MTIDAKERLIRAEKRRRVDFYPILQASVREAASYYLLIRSGGKASIISSYSAYDSVLFHMRHPDPLTFVWVSVAGRIAEKELTYSRCSIWTKALREEAVNNLMTQNPEATVGDIDAILDRKTREIVLMTWKCSDVICALAAELRRFPIRRASDLEHFFGFDSTDSLIPDIAPVFSTSRGKINMN